MSVGSCAAFYLFRKKREQGLQKERRSDLRRTALPGLGRQNWKRKPNCMRRARCAPLACRKLDAAMLLAGSPLIHIGSPAVPDGPTQSMPPFTPLYWVWLNRLKFSQRKSSARVSVKENRLKRPKSKFKRPGLYKVLRPTLPKVRPVGVVKAPGLKRSGPRTPGTFDCTEPWGLPTWSGREPVPTPLATPAASPKSVPLVTLNGVPV